MTKRTSWRCVGCGCVHAPHVDTCPTGHHAACHEYDSVSDAELDALVAEIMPNTAAAKRAGDHAAPSPTRYRALMGDIDA